MAVNPPNNDNTQDPGPADAGAEGLTLRAHTTGPELDQGATERNLRAAEEERRRQAAAAQNAAPGVPVQRPTITQTAPSGNPKVTTNPGNTKEAAEQTTTKPKEGGNLSWYNLGELFAAFGGNLVHKIFKGRDKKKEKEDPAANPVQSKVELSGQQLGGQLESATLDFQGATQGGPPGKEVQGITLTAARAAEAAVTQPLMLIASEPMAAKPAEQVPPTEPDRRGPGLE